MQCAILLVVFQRGLCACGIDSYGRRFLFLVLLLTDGPHLEHMHHLACFLFFFPLVDRLYPNKHFQNQPTDLNKKQALQMLNPQSLR